MAWSTKVKIKHLLTDGEGHEEVQTNMNNIADALEHSAAFALLAPSILSLMRNIPQGDDFFKPVDYANKLLNRVYDFADEYRIWIE